MSRPFLCASACLALWACDVDAELGCEGGEISPQALHERSSSLGEEQLENLILLERVIEKLGDMGAEVTTARMGGAGRVVVCLEQRAISRRRVRACLEVLPAGDLDTYLASRRAIREQIR